MRQYSARWAPLMLKPYQKAELTFDLLKEIGQEGKNSRTFLVRDHQLDAEIVMKQIDKAKLSSPAEFFSESQALYMSSHPNVVQVHYACFDADHIYVAMPYYDRGSLRALMAKGFLTVRQIVTFGIQILTGLHNIHSKKLIHFDVKPDNVLLSPRGEALLSDFGQAKQMNFSGIAAQDRFYGKMIPPEGTSTDHFDRTFDIYQLGLTLYRMCNGDEVFYAQFAKYGPATAFDRDQFRFDLRNGRFPDRKFFHPHIPAALRKVVRKCLETDPTQRFRSAIDVANALAAIDGNSLDWQYKPTAGKKLWTKNENGTIYELALSPDQSTVCHKSVNGGAARRVGAMCMANASERDLQKMLAAY